MSKSLAAPSVRRRIRLHLPVASPQTLAAFRIAVGFVLLVSADLRDAARLGALAPELRVPPAGLVWFARAAPISAPLVQAALAVALFGAAATMLGLYTRAATVVLALATFYLLAIGQLGGTVLHDMHLVWFAVILAVSPCADALSFDAWWARREGRPLVPSAPTAYGVAVWAARLLFACIYFFPGIHKVATQGLHWASADNLSYQLYWKWFEWGEVPSFRFDQHPILLAAGGAGVLAFELSFPLLLFTRRTRVVAAIAGVAFHLATERILRIPFSSLWLCYPVLIDWPRRAAREEQAPRAPGLELGVCAVLLCGAALQGVRGEMRSFPFACYPTFQFPVSHELPDLRVVVVRADGGRFDVPHARDVRGVRTQASWGRVWALAGATNEVDPARLRAYLAEIARARPSAFDGADRIEVYRAYYAVIPGAPAGPVREVLLATFPRDAITPQ